MARPFAVSITFSEADRAALVGWTCRPNTAETLELRTRIVVVAAGGDARNTLPPQAA